MALYERGLARIENDENESAVKDFEAAMKIKPEFTECIYQKGIARMRMKNYSGAIREFNDYIKLKPNMAMAYLKRGICYDKTGQNYKACKDWLRASMHGLYEADALMKMKCK